MNPICLAVDNVNQLPCKPVPGKLGDKDIVTCAYCGQRLKETNDKDLNRPDTA